MIEEKNNVSFLGIILISSFVSISVISNIASAKIGIVFGYAVDMGTFLYPLVFTIRDLVHKNFGKKVAQKMIAVNAITVLFMSGFFFICGLVPEDSSWGLNDAFLSVVSPVFRIAVASIISATIAELIDTEIYHVVYKKFQSKFQWLRVAASNAVSIPVDSVIFSLIAFAGDLPMAVVVEIIVFNIVVKFLVSAISIPTIYLSKDKEAMLKQS